MTDREEPRGPNPPSPTDSDEAANGQVVATVSLRAITSVRRDGMAVREADRLLATFGDGHVGTVPCCGDSRTGSHPVLSGCPRRAPRDLRCHPDPRTGLALPLLRESAPALELRRRRRLGYLGSNTPSDCQYPTAARSRRWASTLGDSNLRHYRIPRDRDKSLGVSFLDPGPSPGILKPSSIRYLTTAALNRDTRGRWRTAMSADDVRGTLPSRGV
jgi:hypothetical protein